MARFRFIFDEMSYSRASEQNSTILIPLRKLLSLTYVVIEDTQLQTLKGLLGFFPPPIYKFCFYTYSLSTLFHRLFHP